MERLVQSASGAGERRPLGVRPRRTADHLEPGVLQTGLVSDLTLFWKLRDVLP